MAFGNAANSGIAGHLGNQIKIESNNGGFGAEHGGSVRGFAARMSSTNDNYIKLFVEARHVYNPKFKLEAIAEDHPYFPMQKVEKIWLIISAMSVSPVMIP